jgi:nucleoside phosphorylase
MSDPNTYTVGWICAIMVEYVAAQLFLDEEHEGPQHLPQNDCNDYKLGKMGNHNVVIAVLPDGEYGTSSAARVAADMHHSFPNVRIGLMVGIGGGAPTQRNKIHLGDVVVSSPANGVGGILPYDSGKAIQDQTFQISKFLNQPPTHLRTAVQGLRSHYEIHGNQLEVAINFILEKKPRLRKYRRPAPNNDILYCSDFLHVSVPMSQCSETCGNDPSSIVSRPVRSEDEDNPMIHYGTIASANTLMKDATVRDQLAAEKGVLCFEMESAGLINHFPCLVIRGICDYADTHKNDEWHGYAAMTAAAYAKDLLHRIPPSKVEAKRRIDSQLGKS